MCVAILIYVNYAHIYFPVWQLGVVITFYGSLFVTSRFAIVRSQSSIPKDIKQSNVVTAVQFSSMLGNKFLKYRYQYRQISIKLVLWNRLYRNEYITVLIIYCLISIAISEYVLHYRSMSVKWLLQKIVQYRYIYEHIAILINIIVW
jgi:hypothetical protein